MPWLAGCYSVQKRLTHYNSLTSPLTEFTKSALHQAKFITKMLKKFEQISIAKTLFGRSFKVKEKNRSMA